MPAHVYLVRFNVAIITITTATTTAARNLLMNRYRPEATPTQQKQMFRFLDNDDSGKILLC